MVKGHTLHAAVGEPCIAKIWCHCLGTYCCVSCHREVDLGPFKHKIDDGLELRKAAFECMDVLLDRCKDCIDMAAFITHLEKGLQVGLITLPAHTTHKFMPLFPLHG